MYRTNNHKNKNNTNNYINKTSDVNLPGGRSVDEHEKNNPNAKHSNNQVDDDANEPCTKKIMPCLFAWYFAKFYSCQK